jgi:acylpyruvate hydrolase
MRLATARAPEPHGGASALFAAGTGGYYHVSSAALAAGVTALAGMADVGDLLRAGDGARAALATLVAELDAAGDPGVALDKLDLLPPVLAPRALVCIGRNYAEHVAEGKAEMPAYPLLFSKFLNALAGHPARVPYPAITEQLDYEGELAVVIGRRASRVREQDAFDHVAGYTIVNDLSARDLQARDLQWIRAKSLDGFAPLGPCVLTADEVADVDALRIQTRVNGELRQDEVAGAMHFKIPRLLAFITEGITLEPGDVVATGTPSGVGLGFDPPRYLARGDVVEVSIEPIGVLRADVV